MNKYAALMLQNKLQSGNVTIIDDMTNYKQKNMKKKKLQIKVD